MKPTPPKVPILLVGVVFLMLGLSYASVPLYRLFCQKTGFGGTPQIAVALPSVITDRWINIRFNADVGGLPFDFYPLQKVMRLRVGELGLAFYHLTNTSPTITHAMAVYNVTPDKAGIYFHKVECFCFKDQTFNPLQKTDLPVQFFIDPSFIHDPDVADIQTITLSYTFFPWSPTAPSATPSIPQRAH